MSAPAVAVSADGKMFAAAWKDVRSGEPNVYWAISNSAEFPPGQLVHDTTKGGQDHPSLCIDSTGVVWVAWEDSRSGSQQVWVRSSLAGDHGQAINEAGKGSFPTIASGNNLVAVIYESRSGDEQTIQFQKLKSIDE